MINSLSSEKLKGFPWDDFDEWQTVEEIDRRLKSDAWLREFLAADSLAPDSEKLELEERITVLQARRAALLI